MYCTTRQPAAGQRRPRAHQLVQEALLRLPHDSQPRASVYCACHTTASHRPAAATRAPAPPGGSVYCSCPSRGPAAATRAPAPPGGSVYCACHAAASCGPAAATRAPAPPGGSVYCAFHTTASRGPSSSRRLCVLAPATRQAAARQRRPSVHQLLQEALYTAPAARQLAAGEVQK